METTTEHAGVPVHPPLFFLSALLLGALIDDRVYPLMIFHNPTGRWIGGVLAIIGVALVATGRATMIKHGTNVNPTQPTITIVQAGPFRFTRNPLYVGLTVIYIGLSLALNTWWSLLLLIPVWIVMHVFVVRREEAYLEGKFGDSYLAYKRRVRRYV
ncbi:MAG TPA: isoprenylcysteine carboxylmethyltransferase family protein [Chthoniobacterales bacterium]|nr:isoprenylcysteine carboxylmethyltransferase family protein [Chthoniobacterales bacterium]